MSGKTSLSPKFG